MAEYFDLYDKNRVKTGMIHQRGEPPVEGVYALVVNVWIMNSKDELLLAQRHYNKANYGGLWECAASGMVLAGEDSLQGALRETKEEIGVDLLPSEGLFLETLFREDSIRDTFLFRKDISIGELTLQPDEVIDVKWVTKLEYERMCKEGLVAAPTRNFWEIYHSSDVFNCK